MARFLISTTPPAFPGDYDEGDIIAVKPDGARFGRKETMARWVEDGGDPADFERPYLTVVDLPGEPADKNLADFDEPVGYNADGDPRRPKAVRGWRFDKTLIPAATWTQMQAPGAEISRGRLTGRGWIRRKKDDAGLPARERGLDGTEADYRHSDTGVRLRKAR